MCKSHKIRQGSLASYIEMQHVLPTHKPQSRHPEVSGDREAPEPLTVLQLLVGLFVQVLLPQAVSCGVKWGQLRGVWFRIYVYPLGSQCLQHQLFEEDG